MTPGPEAALGRAWHRALTAAVTGSAGDEPDRESPDVVELAAALRRRMGEQALGAHVRQTRAAGQPWPHPVPAELMVGLGFAQFAAALASLQRELQLDDRGRVSRAHDAAPMTAELRRLLDDVPPHHGS